jgi:hypothetical protein
VIECLPRKHEALNSNPVPPKNKKKAIEPDRKIVRGSFDNRAWWYTAIIPALEQLKQEDHQPGLGSETLS